MLTDADLSTPIHQFDKLHEKFILGYDIVLGSRSVSSSNVKRKQFITRMFIGRVFNFFIRFFLNLRFNDTQCGFKLINKNKIDKLIDKCFVDRFCIDVEIIYLASIMNFNIIEVGVDWYRNNQSSVNFKKDT